MPTPLQLPPPEGHEVGQPGVFVELALGAHLRNQLRDSSLEVEDPLHIQGQAEILQFLPYLGDGFAPDLYLTAPDDLSGIDSRIDQLDSYPGSRLAIVHRPERGLLAAVLRHLAVMDPCRAEPRYPKQLGLEQRAPVDQSQIRVQRPHPLEHRLSVKIRDCIDSSSEPGPGLPKLQLRPRMGQQPGSGTKAINQQHGEA